MNVFKLVIELAIASGWVVADVYLLFHPAIELLGSPWVPFLIVTYFGAFFSFAAAKYL